MYLHLMSLLVVKPSEIDKIRQKFSTDHLRRKTLLTSLKTK